MKTTKDPKLRVELFAEIKDLYNASIADYDMSLDGLLLYSETYLSIRVLLEGMDTDKEEIRIWLGEEFKTWFFETHDQIIEQFWRSLV